MWLQLVLPWGGVPDQILAFAAALIWRYACTRFGDSYPATADLSFAGRSHECQLAIMREIKHKHNFFTAVLHSSVPLPLEIFAF